MRAPQLLSWGSFLALLIALMVVLAGKQSEVRDLLEPGDQGNLSRSKAASDSVVGQGEEAAVESELQTLVEEAIYQRAGHSGAGDAGQLQRGLSQSQPQIPLGKPLASGGISLDVVGSGGSSIVFCAKPDYYFVCRSIDLETRRRGQGKSHRLGDASHHARAEATAAGGARGTSSEATRRVERRKQSGGG